MAKVSMKQDLENKALASQLELVKYYYTEVIKELEAARQVEEEQNELIDALVAKINYLEGKLSSYQESERCDGCDEMFRRVNFRRP